MMVGWLPTETPAFPAGVAESRKKGGLCMDVNKLKARMVLVGVNGERLADELGISEATFYRRMK